MLSNHLLNWLYLTIIMATFCHSKSFDDLEDNYMMSAILDEDVDIFNKTLLASKSVSTQRNYGPFGSYPTVPPPHLIITSSNGNRGEVPSYAPPSRNSFTPSLPPQYLSPFADKPTLRGSNSDNIIPNRRPIPPPPPLSKLPSEKDRIPIKPPDYTGGLDTRKKSINTPSIQKLPENVLNYSEPSSSPTSTTHRINDTYDIVIPMVSNISSPSILRILDNGKKHDFLGNKPRLEPEFIKPTKNKGDLNPPTSTEKKSTSVSPLPAVLTKQEEQELLYYPQSNIIDVNVNQNNQVGGNSLKEDHQQSGNSLKEEQQNNEYDAPVKSVQEEVVSSSSTISPPQPRKYLVLGLLWNVHIYLIASLFAILTCFSIYYLLKISSTKWLISRLYFFFIQLLLLLIGLDRTFYLLYDAYNMKKTFSDSISRLLYNIVYPFVTMIFGLMFVFLIKTIDIKLCYYYIRKTYVMLTCVLTYGIYAIIIDLYSDTLPYSNVLMISSQCLFIILYLGLCLTFLYLYKSMTHASLRKQNCSSSVYSSPYSDPLRPSLIHCIRILLAAVEVGILMSILQLIGLVYIYKPFGPDDPHPWLWWAFHVSGRVLEIANCFLFVWAAAQLSLSEDEKETHSHNSASGFALFPWGGSNTPRAGSDNGNADDIIYPAMRNSNQTIHHNYSLRSSKPVYEDIFPLNNIRPNSGGGGLPPHLMSHTTDRRSLKRHHHHLVDGDISRFSNNCGGGMLGDMSHSNCGTLVSYVDRRPPPHPQGGSNNSMLVDEKGVVRFRPFNECDPQPPEELFNHSQYAHPIDEYGS